VPLVPGSPRAVDPSFLRLSLAGQSLRKPDTMRYAFDRRSAETAGALCLASRFRLVLHAVRLRRMSESEAGQARVMQAWNHWFPRSGPRSRTAAVPVAPSPAVGVARTEGAAGDLRRDPADPLRTDC
jgi:hypothetical protein